jgi:predicted O-linked N-acetylglucosamine transferase (SPINDLY family)
LAPQLIEQKDMGALEETLMSFQEGTGVQRNEDTEDAIRIMVKHPQALSEYLENFIGKYEQELNASTLKDLRGEYSDLFEKFYSKANLPKVNKLFDSYTTYAKIMEQYNSVKEKATSKTSNFSDEQKKQAKSELEELSKIVSPLQAFESLRIQSLGEPIGESSLRKALNSAYEEKPKKVQKGLEEYPEEYPMAA